MLKRTLMIVMFGLSFGNVQAKATKKQKVYHVCTSYDDSQNSLACAMYHEARNQGEKGMNLVGNVILNRKEHDKYPAKLSKVIYQKHQFSYIKGRRMKVLDDQSWELSLKISKELLSKNPEERALQDKSFGAIFFFKKGQVPVWAKKNMKRALTYKSHVFYKEK